MKLTRVLFVLMLTAVLGVSIYAQGVEQQVGSNGMINWGDQKIRATGIGSPNPAMPATAQRAGAIEAAKRVALRNLLETVRGMSLNSETTVQDYMVTSDVITTRVSGVVRGFTVVDTRYMSTGDVEVTVEVPLSGVGGLGDVLLPANMGGGQFLGPIATEQVPTQSAVFTGLIVDAKGLGLRPAMAPKILDEAGNEIYGSKYVSREWAVQQGMVGYDKDINRARTNDRVTNNPMLVKAVKVSGPNKADVVVSGADAARIHGAAANQNFLDKCKVMFIVD